MLTTASDLPNAISITADQVIFTNVEADESPNGVRGFQTVFCSDEIDKEVLQAEIEPALQYFPRKGLGLGDNPPEFVFFRTSSRQIVVGCITPLLDKLDKFGRKKMLFAHALVFEEDEFLSLVDNNPFAVIDADPFFKSIEEVQARESVQMARPGILPRRLELTPTALTCAPENLPKHWLNSEILCNLVLMASAATSAKRSAFTWEVHGTPQAFLDMVRSYFGLIPAEFRAACSFDTAFVGDGGQAKSNRSSFRINGVGKSQRLQQDSVIRVDLDKDVSDILQFKPEVSTPFEHWMTTTANDDVETFLSPTRQRQIHWASLLQDVFRGRRISTQPSTEAERQTFDEFFQINEKYIFSLLIKNFQKHPGQVLAESLAKHALKWIRESGADALESVPRRFPNSRMCAWLVPHYENQNQDTPDQRILEALERCCSSAAGQYDLMSAAERMMHAFCLTWREKWSDLQAFIALLEPAEFEAFAAWAAGFADLRARPVYGMIGKLKFFFGFLAKDVDPEAHPLVRVMTFYPLTGSNVVPKPRSDKGYYRRIILKLLHLRKVQSEKKNYEGTALTANQPLAVLSEAIILPGETLGRLGSQTPSFPRAMLIEVTTDNVVRQMERSPYAPLMPSAEVTNQILALCKAGNHHVAFFESGEGFVVAEMRKLRDMWTIFLVLVSRVEFQRWSFNPFLCLSGSLDCFVGSLCEPEENQIPTVAKWHYEDLRAMLIMVNRRSPFSLNGTTTEFKNTISRLFRFLPEHLRAHCSYISGDLGPEPALSVLIGLAHDDGGADQKKVVPDLVSHELLEPAMHPRDIIFERTLMAAPRHYLWDSVWPQEVSVFHEMYELSKLLNQPESYAGIQTFTAEVARIFVDQNWSAIRQVLSRRLAENAGSTLGLSLLNEGCFWLKDQLPDSITVLKSGFPDPWLIEQTVDWLLNEQISPLSVEQLRDVEKLQASAACNGTAKGWLLRTLFAGLADKPELLISQMEHLETRDGEEAVEQLRIVIHRLHAELKLDGWRFTLETKNYSNLQIGVQLLFSARTDGENSAQQTPLFIALFGYRVPNKRPDGLTELPRGSNITGKFWPDLIEIIHTSFTPAVENLDAVN